MSNEDDKDCDVGYGCPPRSTRFKRGQSGNPRGRPRGRKSASTIIRDVLYRKMTVTENGRRRQLSAIEVLARQVAKESLEGNHRSRALLLKLIPVMRDLSGDEDAAPAETAEARLARDQEILAALAEMTDSDPGDLFVTAPEAPGDDT